MWNPHIHVKANDWRLWLGFTFDVLDREGKLCTTVVHQESQGASSSIFETEMEVIKWFRAAMLNCIHHEVDESILVDDKRPFDPHAGPKIQIIVDELVEGQLP
jgi:hypothetical protein